MIAARLDPLQQQLAASSEMHEGQRFIALAQRIAIAFLERRAADDQRLVLDPGLGQKHRQSLQPTGPIVVVEGFAARHLGDAFRRVVVISIEEAPSQSGCQPLPDFGLAAAGYAHYDDAPTHLCVHDVAFRLVPGLLRR